MDDHLTVEPTQQQPSNKRKVLIITGVALACIILLVLVGLLLIGRHSNTLMSSARQIMIEEMPKSPFHSPDGTWWGYNMQKITRIGNKVFAFVIENKDSSNKTASRFVMYEKIGDGLWQKGANFPTSRPGNILADSKGVLHAFVFEPYDVKTNDSWGKLKHYWFPKAAEGNITIYKKEIVIDNDGIQETVNIRVGAAIAPDDTMAIAFGLTENVPPNKGQSEHLYVKKPSQKRWRHLIAGQNLGHDFYYPFVFATNNSFHLLPVQDDYYEPDPSRYNVYQKILYMEYAKKHWAKEIIADLSKHPLAKERLRLLEQSELWVEPSGTIHVIYKEFTDPKNPWRTNRLVHVIRNNSSWSKQTIDSEAEWARLFEYKGKLYYLLTDSNRSVTIKQVDGTQELNVTLPKAAQGFYPYIGSTKTGAAVGDYLDIVLHASNPNQYEQSSSYYLRINAVELDKL
ncbi:MAG TPA: hypothetical protein VJJ78_00625 [Candidatus Saccharimonadales bacterium]|nr:hypothetical protein [Candidatus Saccharimonadales bacterium]